jgi:hypothetical protein
MTCDARITPAPHKSGSFSRRRAVFLGLGVWLQTLALAVHANALDLEPRSKTPKAPRTLEIRAVAQPTLLTPGEAFRLFVHVRLSKGWHIYSLNLTGDDAPVATRVHLDDHPFPARGPWRETPAQLALDGTLGKAIMIHRGKAEFRREFDTPQTIAPGTYPLTGHLWFRACDNKVCTMPQKLAFETLLEIAAPGGPPPE